ncbi:hypothetical protein [Cellulomonas sp. Y8]|uniref:hypothetical protein n=1 Tax=Cellulomonas sp. Y8 TaxID=2591145 RepID=UPI0011C86709|nr:hypothetical protein [Cellulomonas sp. Y8]
MNTPLEIIVAVASRLPADIPNPLDNVTPDLNVFGVKFTGAVQLALGGLWAAVLFYTVAAVIIGLAKWAWAKKVSHNREALAEGANEFKQALIVFGIAAMLSLIIGAVLIFAQQANG